MRVWVNFKELRSKLKFEDVLTHYRVEVRRKGNQHQGPCPLPSHSGSRGAQSFSANLERGIFQCFGCGAKGNVLEFAAHMRGTDPKDGDALRAVAVEMQHRFFPDLGGKQKNKPHQMVAEERKAPAVVVNGTLNFELRDLDAGHPYLARGGISREIAHHFGIGFCSRGMLKDRLAIPLHGMDGELLGYAGRVVDDSNTTTDNPKYRFPSKREHSGTIIEFNRSLFLYNGYRITSPCDELIVVNGFPAVWWLTQHGFPRSVALMGPDCSEEQMELIVRLVKPSGRIWLVATRFEAAASLAHLGKLARRRFVRHFEDEGGRRVTELTGQELKDIFR